jgi:hypothetical protein
MFGRAALKVRSLPPLRGKAGEGVPHDELSPWTPTPDPSPQGGGENSVLAAAFESTKFISD